MSAPQRGNVTAVCPVAFFSPRLQGQVLQKRSRIWRSASTLGFCSLVNVWQSASTLGFCSLVDFSVSQSGGATGRFPVANHVSVCAPGSNCWMPFPAQHRDLGGVCVSLLQVLSGQEGIFLRQKSSSRNWCVSEQGQTDYQSEKGTSG